MGWTLGKELGSAWLGWPDWVDRKRGFDFAKVKLVTRKSDGLQSACKIIKKPKGAPRRSGATPNMLTASCSQS